ncbi:MAG: hypothetical protein UZ17_ACD001001194 [Acidobacteria bacterium OLB17]|nr:MAG: hypothetical protein UZ17_ACD001001194 [Acidobacteria bacterium OLB17]MCZ2391862.1 energy transducer TonB [Acidobacteriota bacterium]
MLRSKLLPFLTVILLVALSVAVHAQDDGDDEDDDDDQASSVAQCLAPASFLFDEVIYSDTVRLEKVIRDFREKLYSLPPKARGIIYVYGGRETAFDEVEKMTASVKAKVILGMGSSEKLTFLDGGYRENATVVFTIRPLDCSTPYGSRSEVDLEGLQFKEFPVEETVRLSNELLEKQVETDVFGTCPGVARTLGMCSQQKEVRVLVAVDKEGKVRFARGVDALQFFSQAASNAAKLWKFRPFLVAGAPKNVVGVIVVRFPAVTSGWNDD